MADGVPESAVYDNPAPPGQDGTLPQSPTAAARFLDRLAPGEPDPPPGYRFVDKLGRGGMGVVYRAVQTDLGREVALKMILSGEYASDDEIIRFENEVKAVAAVRHENVVQVHHAGRHAGKPFLALEYLPDGSLAQLLRDGPLPPREAAEVVEQVARGVAACHAVGILHRDLKPGNVLLQLPDGRGTATGKTTVMTTTGKTSQNVRVKPRIVPKVADFGLAKRLDSADGLTYTGAVLGTPSYMPPEQARGEPLAATADVYSLGAIFYATLTGRPPFQSPSRDETLRRVVHDDPLPVRQLQPATPRDLETICLKCLAKDPAARYATAAELADDLQRWAKGEPIRARRANVLERGWKLIRRNREWAAVFLALMLGLGVAVYQLVLTQRARAAEALAGQRKLGTLQFFLRAFSQASASGQARHGDVNPKLTIKEALDFAVNDIGDRFADQPEVEIDVRSNVGRLYHEMKQYREAAGQFERVVELQDATRPADDPDRVTALVALGDCYRLLNDPRAVPTLERALQACDAFRPHGVEKYKCLNTLARAYYSFKRTADALDAWQKSLAGRRQLVREAAASGRDTKPLDEEVAKSLQNLGVYHYDHSAYAAAETHLLEAYQLREKTLSLNHPDTVTTVRALADLYYYWKPRQADEWYRRAVEITRKIEPGSWSQAADELRLAQYLISIGDFAAAEPYIGTGCECLGRCGEDVPAGVKRAVKDTIDMVAAFWKKKGQPEKAAPWLKKLAAVGK
jgi:tetratricopeptide (TPR) repeat protein